MKTANAATTLKFQNISVMLLVHHTRVSWTVSVHVCAQYWIQTRPVITWCIDIERKIHASVDLHDAGHSVYTYSCSVYQWRISEHYSSFCVIPIKQIHDFKKVNMGIVQFLLIFLIHNSKIHSFHTCRFILNGLFLEKFCSGCPTYSNASSTNVRVIQRC